jgi:site-specific recombinase XerD
MKLREAINFFLSEGGFSSGTIRLYRRYLFRFADFLGNVKVEKITHLQFTHFKAELSKEYSKLCTYKAVVTIRSLFKFLKDNGIKVQIDGFKVDKPPEGHFGYTKPEDVALALKYATKKYKCVIYLIYTTGLRVQEVADLRACNYNFNDGIIKLVGKGGKPAKVYMTGKLKKMLLEYPDGFGIGAKSIRHYFQRLREKLGIKIFHPHSLRKSFATEMNRRSNDIYKVSKLLRHTDIKTTQNYAIVEDVELQEFHNKYIQDNHEINCCKKVGGRVKWEIKGWIACGGKVGKVERAISKAIGEVLEGG